MGAKKIEATWGAHSFRARGDHGYDYQRAIAVVSSTVLWYS